MKSSRQELLYRIQALSFTIWELHLFLNTHPDKKEFFDLPSKKQELMLLMEEYANLYGPLNHLQATGDRWGWLSDPWPWERTVNESEGK